MNHSVSQALVRDSEGWFVLMDMEETTLFHHSYASSSIMGWRDNNKNEEEVDGSSHLESKDTDDTESQKSMIESFPTNPNILSNHTENWPHAETVTASPPDIQKLIIDETPPLQDPRQNVNEPIIHPIFAMPDVSNSLGTSNPQVTHDQSVKLTVLSSSPERPASPESVNEKELPNSLINSTKIPSVDQPFIVLSDLLDRFGTLIIINYSLPQALFKVGALIYLLFLGRVMRKIWLMFQSQALAVGLGNLALSIMISLLVRLNVHGQVRMQLDEVGFVDVSSDRIAYAYPRIAQKYTVPETVVDSITFVGAFTCVSIIWQTALIVGDFVAYL
ncbi:hypothetical protein C8R42DRAFT_720721 [Lentinula raphanica]|nr:hypothetical protein C8R42DRAFT_720721 [Lentinula raphanica]